MNSFNPPSPKDTEPGPGPTLPPSLPADSGLWGESDMHYTAGPAASAAAAPSDPPLPRGEGPAPTIGHIGRYALKHRLGEGGLGTVYAAHDPLLSRLIAVKTLNVELQESERASFNAMFLNEARAAAGLSHPHIVTVFDAGVSDDRAYIAMELLKGRDLRQLRQHGWRATPAQAALIVRRVADALGYAHSKGVVHRDVKPANIFMIGRTQPKVLDFGIARIAHRHDVLDDIVAGSPYYMAPEQVRRENVDRRADVFALGVVLYELLTDVKPFRGSTLEEITNAVMYHTPPQAHSVDARVPEALAAIAARAMEKDPEHRYRSARALSRELRHWLDENAVGTEGDVPADAVPSRRPWQLAAAALAVLAVGGAGWALLAAPRAPALASTAPLPAAAAPLQPSAPAPEPAAAPAAVATDAAVTVAPTAPDATTATAATGPAAPPAAAPAPKDAKKDAAKEKERRAREARAATPPPATPAAAGLVRIAISPWGSVEVDGRAVGVSPPMTELSLAPGSHQIVVRNADMAPLAVTVNVTADQPVTVKHKF